MSGTRIDITARSGGTFAAYVSRPATTPAPCIVLLHDRFGLNRDMRDLADLYADEGYVVVAPDLFWRIKPGIDLDYGPAAIERAAELAAQFDWTQASLDVVATIDAARNLSGGTRQVGVLGFGLGGRLAVVAAPHAQFDALVIYDAAGVEKLVDDAVRITCPMALHCASNDPGMPVESMAIIRSGLARSAAIHSYLGVGAGFALPGHPSFDKPASYMAHSRSLGVFRRAMGPIYDLGALWEKHTAYEFAVRDADATMRTMVAQPYVNHIPTMTGGVGQAELHRFYKHHFIPRTPRDTKLVPMSRTIGVDRVVDEMLFCFTHDIEIDWMLPGVPPTGKYVEIPLVAIVGFRGDKIWHEHIYWDQASVLVQIGLLEPGTLPIAGRETARKVLDERLPSNTLMTGWSASAGKD